MDLDSRKTIEALRAGVPNRDAVRQLGCNAPTIEGRFRDLLEACTSKSDDGQQVHGFAVQGDFGSGKSHLLEYLQHIAIQHHFVVSKIVISKETSLADLRRLFEAAANQARVPNHLGTGLDRVAQSLDFRSPSCANFFPSLAESELAPHFQATVWLYDHLGSDDNEFSESIVRFWCGSPLRATDLKRKLREMGQQATYDIHGLPLQRELALQRFRFGSKLVRAAGYKGWIILIDEVELVGRYGLKSRARAYEQLAWLCGKMQDAPGNGVPGLAAVAAITSDFDSSVLNRDREDVPNKLRSTGRDGDDALATAADRGIRFLLRDRLSLPPVSPDAVSKVHDQLQKIYADAFDWNAPPLPSPPIRTSAVMRPLVRRWITEWDLLRLFPGTAPDVEFTPVTPEQYSEDSDVEAYAEE